MENNDALNQFIQILLPSLATFLTVVFTYIGNKIKTAYEQKANQHVSEQVIANVVKYVEQVYVDIKGPEKLQKAIEQASMILSEKGIKITDAEIYMLIESAVYGLNDGLKSGDKNTQNSEPPIDSDTANAVENVTIQDDDITVDNN